MRAVYIDGHDGVASVKLGQRPDPVRGAGEVLVRIQAAALNRVDLYMMNGGAGVSHQLPLVLGLDAAGVVEDPGDSGLPEGAKVIAYPGLWCGECEFCRKGEPVLCLRMRIVGEQVDGVFRDRISLPAANLLRLPDDADPRTACCLPVAYLTAWRMLFTKGRVLPGEDVLIFGVGGGVALAAMQLAKVAGARVIVTSRSEEKLARARELGADLAINGGDDVRKAVMDFTNGRGVDLVIENVGEQTIATGLRCLVRGGRLVTCGATTGGMVGNVLQLMFIRQLSILGSTMGNPDELAALTQMYADGRVVPVVDRVFPLDQAAEALALLEAGQQFGKIVLDLA